IDVEKIAERDPDLVAAVRDVWAAEHGAPPLATPLKVDGHRFERRRVELDDVGGPLVSAPPDEDGLAAAAEALPASGLVAVHGGTSLTRVLLCEEARLRRGLVAVLVDDLDDAAAETVLLAGRADAVASPGETR
ncbi:hypothetical protein, partial [Solicola sp. PLA-1-18]|uniref:hypothetical protein n=1 Tax=Solicola sp. PLA-1-18 TaxID=3380532 RepID=UPI003B764517